MAWEILPLELAFGAELGLLNFNMTLEPILCCWATCKCPILQTSHSKCTTLDVKGVY